MSTRARRPSASASASASARAATVKRHQQHGCDDEGKESADGNQSTPARSDAARATKGWSSPLNLFSNVKGAFDDEWLAWSATETPKVRPAQRLPPDSARAYHRGDDGYAGSPSKMKHTSPLSRAHNVEFIDAIDDAIDAAIGATVSSMSVVGGWLGMSAAARRAKKDDDDADACASAMRTQHRTAMRDKENICATPPVRNDVREMERHLEETRAELAGARTRERDAARKYEVLKKQNLALQKRQVARETKLDETSETMTVVEQLKAQVEALMSEKASMTREINALTRANKDMRAFMVCNGLIASDDEDDGDDAEEHDGINAVSDEGDISTASSDIDALSAMDREALEREIAELEASLSAASTPADKEHRNDATI